MQDLCPQESLCQKKKGGLADETHFDKNWCESKIWY